MQLSELDVCLVSNCRNFGRLIVSFLFIECANRIGWPIGLCCFRGSLFLFFDVSDVQLAMRRDDASVRLFTFHPSLGKVENGLLCSSLLSKKSQHPLTD